MTLTWIAQLAITCVVAIIAYFLKDMKKTHEDKIQHTNLKVDNQDKKIEQMKEDFKDYRQELNDYKQEVGKEYVRKEDYLQTVGEISRKMDKIYDILMEMNKKGCGH